MVPQIFDHFHLQSLAVNRATASGGLRLVPQVRGGVRDGALEVAGENGLHEGAEDDLGTGSLRKGHPQDHDKFEGVVEGYELLV